MLDSLAGQIVTGKWKKRTYHLMQTLGKGENGIVYLAECQGSSFALKISRDATALSLEWERMRELGTTLASPCPKVYELDDGEMDGQIAHFFVMDYIEGMNLRQYVSRYGDAVVPGLVSQLASLLHSLHEKGYVYGDLKPENVLVNLAKGKPVLIDFGGVTPMGTVIKEFTEIYDRAFWGWGMRKADEHYDYFSLALLGAFLYRPMTEGTREKLMQSSPDERKTALFDYFQRLRARRGISQLLYLVVCGKIRRFEEFSEALQKYRDEDNARSHKRRMGWDVTDWGLFVSILLFAFTAISIWFLGGHQSLFVIQ